MSAALLTMRGVTCQRGGRLLFEGLDLSLERGGAAIVTGPNGAGKSSLLRLAAGLLEPAAGTILREGAVALADERPALDEKRNLGDALAFWARLTGGDAAKGIAAMGLERLADVPVAWLSTGQRRRASLARVIASKAPLWLLDEPLSGLDAASIEQLASAMAAHRDSGGAILAATHPDLPLPGAATRRLG